MLSEPLCLNADYKIIKRKCQGNGYWSKREQCHYVFNFCPKDFHFESEYCLNTTKKTFFNGSCPLTGNLFVPNDYIQRNKKLWFTPIVIEKDDLTVYYTPQMKQIVSYAFLDSPKCFKTFRGKVSLEDCNNLNYHLCAYKPDDFLYLCPKKCVPAGLNTKQCYCKQHEPCTQTATPTFYYQYDTLRNFAKDCYFNGLLKSNNYKCFLCEIDALNNPTAQLTLTFGNKKRKLYLVIISAEGLHPVDGQMAQCFKHGYELELVEMSIRSDKYTKDIKRKIIYKLEISDKPAEYFCIARQKPNLNIIKSNYVVTYMEFKGHAYAMQINMPSNLVSDLKRHFSRKSLHLELMREYQNNENNITYIYHVIQTSVHNVYSDYYQNLRLAYNFLSKDENITISYFRSLHNCFPDDTSVLNSTINWPLTNVGTVRSSSDVCLQNNGLPLLRKCIGNFLNGKFNYVYLLLCIKNLLLGAYWDDVIGECDWSLQKTSTTRTLENYVSDNSTLEANIVENITIMTKENLGAYDVFLLAKVFEKLYPGDMSVYFFDIVNNLIGFNKNVLNQSQIVFKSTDKILNYIDTYLINNSYNFIDHNDGYYLEQKNNIILQISYPFLNNITGLAAYGNKNDTFNNFNVTKIYKNITEDDLLFGNLQIATYLSDELLNDITLHLTNEQKNNLPVIITIFFNDSMFNSNNFSQRIDGSVVSIVIPQLMDDFFNYTVPLYFNSSVRSTNSSCVYWDYDTEVSQNSTWSDLGNEFMEFVNESNILRCEFLHLTHFGLLITTQPIVQNEDDSYVYYDAEEHDYVLDIITYVGCTLSIIGVFIIFISFILLEKFRQKTGSKILIQISFAIILEISALQISGKVKGNTNFSKTLCSIVGFLLHYIVLSKFCWMLISAYLQYHRFVKVFGPPPKHILLKSFLFGWITPLIPALIVYLLTSGDYEAGLQNFCYPKGLTLYIAVFAPITIIAVGNLIVFCLIMINVTGTKQKPKGSHNDQKYQVFLAILLFFLLGLPWIFGILAEVISMPLLRLIFLYLFCILATLQGFVIFVFYIILDKDTRSSFMKRFKKAETYSSRSKSSSDLVQSKISD